jgi:hypothetical protein
MMIQTHITADILLGERLPAPFIRGLDLLLTRL